MGEQHICLIDGCSKRAGTRGWCANHYARWLKHGSPTGGKTSRGEAESFIRDVVLVHEGDDCLIWPYSRSIHGYGQARHKGRLVRVHIIACESANGPKPSPDAHAAHNCGNGSSGCVNRKHLRWANRIENKADELTHGTRCRGETHGRHKLTEAEVKQIRLNIWQEHRSGLADRFNVSRRTIRDVQARRSWDWLE